MDDRLRNMLAFDGPRWSELTGGYRVVFDPRPYLAALASEQNTELAWRELWEGLHHQGDVGDASYASVPHLVQLCKQRNGTIWSGWNVCALVSTIELARTRGANPPIPEWCKEAYFAALKELGVLAAHDLATPLDTDTARALLSIVAISQGLRRHGELMVLYSEEEMEVVCGELDQ